MTTARQTRRTAKKDAWRPVFLETLRRTGNVLRSAEAASVGRTFAYAERDRDPAFAADWAAALEDAADVLELEARRRAVEGVEKPITSMGKLVYQEVEVENPETGEKRTIKVPVTITEYSDTLLIFLMKGANPEKYRERSEVRHSGKVDLGKLSDDELRAILES